MKIINKLKPKNSHLYNIDDISDQVVFIKKLLKFLDKKNNIHNDIIILCIGTDRATGDSLGPLIGHKLKNTNYPNVHIIGTLDHPVHAKNLEETISNMYSSFNNPLIIAIDACLGKIDHIGFVGLGEGGIKPGAGVNKDLPMVGDIFITGIVNFSGYLDMVILQNTRLSIVMKMADFISFGIKSALWKYFNQNQDYNSSITFDEKQLI